MTHQPSSPETVDVPRSSLFDALAEAIFAIECPGIRYTKEDQEFYRRAAKAAWMEMHAPVEPVAWRWRYKGDHSFWTVGMDKPSEAPMLCQPLFTYSPIAITLDAAQRPLHPEDRTIFVLQEIARGRCDNGRPLGGETARQMARAALDTWPGRTPVLPSTHQPIANPSGLNPGASGASKKADPVTGHAPVGSVSTLSSTDTRPDRNTGEA